ncbi:MAG: C13 family peptidase [Desulforhabdus sp.]|nr:C13 family peptidase [Desulforhabdus sp.]
MGRTNKVSLVVMVSLWFLAGLGAYAYSAQIDSLQFAYDKLVADVLGNESAAKEVLGNPEIMDGHVAIETTTGSVYLGEGPGWVFFIEDKTAERPFNLMALITVAGEVTRKDTKGQPLSLSDYVPMGGMKESLVSSLIPVSSMEEAYNRLVDELLGHTVGNRRVYAIPSRLEGQVAIENWEEQLFLGQGPGWLFFVDDNPRANWEHACRFVLVTEAGEILVTRSMTPPKEMTPFQELTPAPSTPGEGNAIEQLNNSLDSTGTTPKLNVLPGVPNTPATNRWAVIVSGGYNQASNYIRYWNDCSYFYKTLIAHGFQDDHIYVLISDGTNPAADRSNGTNSSTDLDGDGDADTQYSATKANITAVFNTLQGQLGANDILYIFATDHGGSNDIAPYDDPTVKLYLWGETITDSEFATEVNKVTTRATVGIFEQCFSGGMIDNLQAPNRVLISAARFWELSYAMGPSYDYDEFSYYFTYAAANPAAADGNADGVASMEEAYLYALAHDSRQSESINGDGDNEGEHPSYYSSPWDLGRRISLYGLDEEVADPWLSGYTQAEVTESFPTGGTAQSWSADEGRWEYTLPFSFPYFGASFSKVTVDANGIVYLGTPGAPFYSNTVNDLKAKIAIAPLWDDLTVYSSDGDVIYTSADSQWVTIRWKAHTFRDDRPVNVAVKLSSSGAVKFLYGSGNDHTSRIVDRDKTIGISKGDGSNYHLCLRNGQWNLGNATGIEYAPKQASSRKVLYFCDYNFGNNWFPRALSQLGLDYTVATSYADFESKLSAGRYDLVILLMHNFGPGGTRPTSLPNFEAYLSGGGRAIFTDWYRDPRYAPYFGITYVGGPGTSDLNGANDNSVNVTSPFLSSSTGSTMLLTNPGWSIFSVGMNLNGASKAASYAHNGYVAIAYTPKTIINGPLKDTFADDDQGLALAKAEISRVLGSRALPAILSLLLD